MNFVNLTRFTFNSSISEKLTYKLVFSDTQLFTNLYYLTRDLFCKGGMDGWGVLIQYNFSLQYIHYRMYELLTVDSLSLDLQVTLYNVLFNL